MRRVKALLIGSLAMAWLMAAGTLPATAADPKGTLAIVNGIPGQKVDVCLNGKEIKSGLAYGGKLQMAVVATGNKTLKFTAKDPRKCKGANLGQRQFSLQARSDLTIVVTKNAPRVLVFDNAGLGEIPPLGEPLWYSPYAVRHAAEVAANIRYVFWLGPPGPDDVSPSGVFGKGQSYAPGPGGGLSSDHIVEFQATPIGGSRLISAPLVRTVADHRYEWILVGSKASNARWVFIDRVVSLPSP